MSRLAFLAISGALLVLAPSAAAQTPAPPDSACSFHACALRFEDNRLLRGAAGDVVAKPGAFTPVVLAPHVRGDSAVAHAIRHDRAASQETWLRSVGGLAMLAGLATAWARDNNCERDMFGVCPDGDSWQTASVGLVIGGTVATLVSIPLLRRAEREKARAVWWHNSQFAR